MHTFIKNLLNGQSVEWKTLGEVCEIETGRLNANAHEENGLYPFFTTAKEISRINTFKWDTEALLIAGNANVGDIKHYIGRFNAYQRTYVLKDFKNISVRYLYHYISGYLKPYLEINKNASAMTYIVLSVLKNFQIPLPPLPVQQKIVQILDAFTAITAELTAELTARKKQYEYYRDLLLDCDNPKNPFSGSLKVEWKSLGEVFDILAGGDVPKEALSEIETNEFNVPILSNGINEKSLYGWTSLAKITKPSLTISARGTIGWTSYQKRPFFPIVRLLVLTPKIEINLKYSYYFMKTIENNYKVPESGIPQLTKPMVKDIKKPQSHP